MADLHHALRIVFEAVEQREDLGHLVEPVALAGAQLLDDADIRKFLDRILGCTPRAVELLGEIAGVERRLASVLHVDLAWLFVTDEVEVELPGWRSRGPGRQPGRGVGMKGHVASYETKAGRRWSIFYDLPPTLDPETGETKRRQRQRRGFTRKRDAEKALRQAIGSVEEARHVDHRTDTLGSYLVAWLEGLSLKPTTIAQYRQQVRRRILPHDVAAKRLQDVTTEDLDRLYRHLETAGGLKGRPLSPKSVRHTHGVLRKAHAVTESASSGTRSGVGHVAAAGLPSIRLHDVRHTYATVALSNGEPPPAAVSGAVSGATGV